MNQKSIFALVCAGGGAHGAYQVGVLKYIHEHFSVGKRSPFQLFAGSSCGALNTSFYAAQSFDAYASRLWLEELWLNFHVPQYHGNIFKNSIATIYRHWRRDPMEKEIMLALLDPKPMTDVIRKGFQRSNLEKSFAEGSTLGIGVAATELLSGRTCWFQEGTHATAWNLFHSVGVLDRIEDKHIAASCSVPIFLPPVKIGPRFYLDGQVSLERPLSAAISMGATRILNIGTDKPAPLELPNYDATMTKPKMTKVIRMLINRLAHDAAGSEAAEIQMFNRFYQALSRRKQRNKPNEHPFPLFHEKSIPSHYHPLEIYLFYPSKRIRETEGVVRSESGTEARTKRTSFMFHESFIRELINLGYSDGKINHDTLHSFFNPEVKKKWRFFRKRKD